MYKIYYNKKNGNNDAVFNYLNIIKNTISLNLKEYKEVNKLRKIKSGDKVITIEYKEALKAIIFKRVKVYHWFQGIIPEESYMRNSSKIRKYILEKIEKFILNNTYGNFFVSMTMKKNYENKYTYKRKNFVIMPCFNMKLNCDSFKIKNKYNNLTFVYAGNLAKWQCFEQTLLVYKNIEKDLLGSKITILTKDKVNAIKLLKKNNIKNYEVSYIKPEKLNETLKQYKYGFLLREDILINNVSTPTKMNTYLSSGIIPIYSECIIDFKENFKKNKEFIIIKNDLLENSKFVEISNKISEHHNEKIDIKKLKYEYEDIFNNYYNPKFYYDKIWELLK